MRILIINDFAKKVGGAEIYIHLIRELLEERGHQVRFVGGNHTSNMYLRYVKSLYNLSFKRRVATAVEEFAPDLAFIHSVSYNVSPSFLSVIHGHGIPVVQTVHEMNGLSYRRYPNLSLRYYLPSFVRKVIHRWLIKKYVDTFIAPSDTARQHLCDELGVEPVTTLRNPVFWKIRETPAVPEEARVLYVGRLDQKKGVQTLLDAFARLRRDVDASLEIIGTGEYAGALRARAEQREITDHVAFPGYVPQSELRDRYRAASVFVLPSIIEENCPLSIMEAMSQGTPIISTNFGGQRELLDGSECGLLFEPGDVAGLTRHLNRLLTTPALQWRLSENALEAAHEFSKETHVDNLEAVFKSVV